MNFPGLLYSQCLEWLQDWKRSIFIPIPKKGNAKECSNYRTIALISHTSGLPWWLRRQSVHLQCRRPGFDPCVGKIPLEKDMATHFSTLTWKIPWMEEPGGLQYMGLQKVRQNSATSLHFTSLHFTSLHTLVK